MASCKDTVPMISRSPVMVCRFIRTDCGGITMEKILGEFWMFKLIALIGAAYLFYIFIKDRMRKK